MRVKHVVAKLLIVNRMLKRDHQNKVLPIVELLAFIWSALHAVVWTEWFFNSRSSIVIVFPLLHYFSALWLKWWDGLSKLLMVENLELSGLTTKLLGNKTLPRLMGNLLVRALLISAWCTTLRPNQTAWCSNMASSSQIMLESF